MSLKVVKFLGYFLREHVAKKEVSKIAQSGHTVTNLGICVYFTISLSLFAWICNQLSPLCIFAFLCLVSLFHSTTIHSVCAFILPSCTNCLLSLSLSLSLSISLSLSLEHFFLHFFTLLPPFVNFPIFFPLYFNFLNLSLSLSQLMCLRSILFRQLTYFLSSRLLCACL